MTVERLKIVHIPQGYDAPYSSLFEERRPRDPAGGDMVTIGFLTQPGAAAESPRLYWTRNGRPQTPIGARAVAQTDGEDRWLVELGVLEAGDRVEYWIEALHAGELITSPRYRFSVRRWRRLAGCTLLEQGEASLLLTTIADDGRPGPLLTIERPASAKTLRLLIAGNCAQASASVTADSSLTFQGEGIALHLETATGRLRLVEEQSEGPQERLAPLSLRWLEDGAGRLLSVELLGPLADRESLVGFGERFDALDQRGRTPDILVYEQYKNQGNRTYLPVPFFLSSAGYGCLVEGTTRVNYDLGRTAYDRWRCVAALPQREGGLAVDLFVGKPAAILSAFTRLSGLPAPPPAWAFGLWMSSNEWNTQARVEAEFQATQQHQIPATVLVIEAWSDETTFYIWNGARYQARDGADAPQLADFHFPADGPWPDPQAMIERLHAAGIRLILWQIPALKHIAEPHAQHDADTAHALEQGYVIRNADGTPYRNHAFWFNQALIPDFTNTQATDWWLAKRRYLLEELCIDGFKTDGGEHLQGRDLLASDGRRGDELINAFPMLYIGAYHRFAQQLRGGDALTFSRAGHTGAGAYPAHWAGDENSTWEAYRRSIVAGLSAGLSGVPFWGWDIAGFSEDLPTAELYLRALAMAAFCPIMQYHSEYNPGGPSRDRTPWNIQHHSGDQQVIPLSRFFARLRMNLLPYILSEAAHCAESGEPLMRPLLFDHPGDEQCWSLQDQYAFGRDLLVAPVVEEGASTRRLYLPQGSWYDLWTGAVQSGGRWIEVEAPLERIPVYVRAGAILPLNLGANGELGDDVGNQVDGYSSLTFRLYPAERMRLDWVDAAGQRHTIAAERQGHSLILRMPPLPIACTLALPDGTIRRLSASQHEQELSL